jgi:hypothetical protein
MDGLPDKERPKRQKTHVNPHLQKESGAKRFRKRDEKFVPKPFKVTITNNRVVQSGT